MANYYACDSYRTLMYERGGSAVQYDARKDGLSSWLLAIRWKSITAGVRRPATPAEMYWAEAAGVIP